MFGTVDKFISWTLLIVFAGILLKDASAFNQITKGLADSYVSVLKALRP
jgi:hypothetical protein